MCEVSESMGRTCEMTCQHKNKKAMGYSYGSEVSTLYYCNDCGRTFWLTVNDEIATKAWEGRAKDE